MIRPVELELVKELLVEPGEGVFTIHTGKEFKDSIKHFYKKSSDKPISLNDLPFTILGIPFDGGAGIIRGSNWGPLFLRKCLLENANEYFHLTSGDIGDLKINPHLLEDSLLNTSTIKNLQAAMFEGKDLPVSALSQLEVVSKILFTNVKKCFFFGGDHSISYPIVKSWLASNNTSSKEKKAIIHFDAHTDLLEKRLGIEHCFGTWAYHASKILHHPSHLLQFGIRSSGKNKEHWEKTLGIKQWWATEIHHRVPENNWIIEAVAHLKNLGITHLYLSFDVDVLDPQYLSCTGTAESAGLAPHHLIDLLTELKKHFTFDGMDVVELAPFIQSPLKPMHTLEPENSLLNLKQILSKIIHDIIII